MDEHHRRPSPNFDARDSAISMVVLHYTGMEDAASAIARLRDPEAAGLLPLSDRRGRPDPAHGRRGEARLACRPFLLARRPRRERLQHRHRDRQSRPRIRLSARSPRSRWMRCFRCSPTSSSATASCRPTSSAIPTSRRRASRIPANCSIGRGWRGTGSRSPGRPAIWSIRTGPTAASCSRSNAGAMTCAIARPRSRAFQRRFRPELLDGDDRRRVPRDPAPACSWTASPERLYRPGQRVGRPRPAQAGRGKSGLHGTTVPVNGRRGRPQGKCHRKQSTALRSRQGRKGAVRAHRAAGNGGGTANPTGSKTE